MLAGFAIAYEIGIDDFFDVLGVAFPNAKKPADILPYELKDE